MHYLIRSKIDGQYLVARPRSTSSPTDPTADPTAEAGFIILFSADHDALSYLNKHAAEHAPKFAIEAITNPQLKLLMERWGFAGIALVKDPLIPQLEFLVKG
jgi:hypothetical protein